MVLFSRGFLAMNPLFLKRLTRLSSPRISRLAQKTRYPGNWLLEISAQLMGRDAKVAVGGELTDSNSHSVWRQTVLFQTGQARNKPRSLRPPAIDGHWTVFPMLAQQFCRRLMDSSLGGFLSGQGYGSSRQ